MKIFVAGATGVLGRNAVPRFLEAGHEVTGVARSEEKAAWLRARGAATARVEVFDPDALRDAVAGHDVVCNFATHIPPVSRVALRRAWHQNDRLHTEGARNLVDAALVAGARVYLQHAAGFFYADGGDAWLEEDAPLIPPPHGIAILEAERLAARFAQGGGAGIALRYGFFYGPDAPTTRDFIRAARLHLAPGFGKPEAYYPSVHTTDLGTSAVAALGASTGAYNIVEDEPLTRQEFAESLGRALGINRLRKVPAPRLQRLDYVMRSQRVSNSRFKDATGWTSTYASAREGWPATIAAISRQSNAAT